MDKNTKQKSTSLSPVKPPKLAKLINWVMLITYRMHRKEKRKGGREGGNNGRKKVNYYI